MAVIVNVSLSASLSEFDAELVSITSPVFSPETSIKPKGVVTEYSRTLFELEKNIFVPSLLKAIPEKSDPTSKLL